MINLHDSFLLDGVRKTGDGYLTAFARVARTGIQTYKGYELGRPDLDTVRVYRSPEEVFAPDAMRSFAHRPVTLKHPPKPVNSNNWKQFAGGQTGEDVVRDGDFVRVPMVMMDAKLIDAFEKQGIDQLSMGYSTDIQWRAGVTDAGEQYDAVQTAIRANHLALVPVARGGDRLRVGDDQSATTCPDCGAEMHDGKCPECGYTKDGETEMKTIVIDGLNVSVADDQSASIVQRHIDGLTAQVAKLTDAQTALATAQTQVSAKDGEIAVLKQKLVDAEITPAKLDVLVKDRMAVIDNAAKLLPKEFAFDGKTISDIRRATVEHKLGDAAKNMDDAAIGGAFAALTVDAAASDKSGTQPIVDAFASRRPGAAITTPTQASDAAYEEMCKSMTTQWQPKRA